MSEIRRSDRRHALCKGDQGMNSKISFLLARAGVVTAIVCALLSLVRYSLTEIFVGGFWSGDEHPFIDLMDGRFVLFTVGCAALGIGLIELSRYFAVKGFARARGRLAADAAAVATLASDSVRPKFG